ncbi:MAG: glutamyl-tRNA reductase [Candidatus Zixiibacteriota bacterium]
MATANWYLVVSGISHKTSTLKQREPLQISREELPEANAVFRALPGILESTIVATCNRIEFYCVVKGDYEPFQVVRTFYQDFKGVDIAGLRSQFYMRRDKHVAHHLFGVAAGLDSMVLGENQILGQVKQAYSSACAVKAAGKVIHRLFHQAFRVGKQVRTDTEMGKGACSVSSAAVELLKEKLDGVEAPLVLFVGLNQMIALAASQLNKWDGARFMFANRTPEKAVSFAAKYGATGHSLADLPQLLAGADVVISCTSANTPVITHVMLDELTNAHPDKRLTIMDMAIPRDVEYNNGAHPSIMLYDLEDVRSFTRQQQAKRELAVPEAQAIIERKLDEFLYWFDHVRHEPLYNELEDSFEEVRRVEMDALLEKLEPELRKKVNSATRRLVDRLLSMKLQALQSQQSE